MARRIATAKWPARAGSPRSAVRSARAWRRLHNHKCPANGRAGPVLTVFSPHVGGHNGVVTTAPEMRMTENAPDPLVASWQELCAHLSDDDGLALELLGGLADTMAISTVLTRMTNGEVEPWETPLADAAGAFYRRVRAVAREGRSERDIARSYWPSARNPAAASGRSSTPGTGRACSSMRSTRCSTTRPCAKAWTRRSGTASMPGCRRRPAIDASNSVNLH